ncbi:MAG: DUF5343 domain-containing protein [Candidatus Aminicenantales bacterium]
MADKHPYITSAGGLIQVINHLRSSFPASLTADTLKKLGYAPKNETYIISTLRFLGLIDKDGGKTEAAGKIFSLHQDKDFQKAFAQLVTTGYKELFALHGEKTWGLNSSQLITFFRQNDQSSAIVGKRQANTFLTLSGLSGHHELPEAKGTSKTDADKKPKKKQAKATPLEVTKAKEKSEPKTGVNGGLKVRDVGLTVRIEINLPAEGTQETYDRIFKSIRENLLNG